MLLRTVSPRHLLQTCCVPWAIHWDSIPDRLRMSGICILRQEHSEARPFQLRGCCGEPFGICLRFSRLFQSRSLPEQILSLRVKYRFPAFCDGSLSVLPSLSVDCVSLQPPSFLWQLHLPPSYVPFQGLSPATCPESWRVCVQVPCVPPLSRVSLLLTASLNPSPSFLRTCLWNLRLSPVSFSHCQAIPVSDR